MITMQLKEVIEATPAIFRVLGTKLPVKAAYHLAKIGKKLQAELTDYNDERVKLIKELGEEQKDGGYQVKPENLKSFTDQHTALIEVEIKIDLDPLKLETLGEKPELAAADLMACDKLIVE
jgi:hypothetical protein